VSIPTTNLLFQFMDVPPRHAPSPTSSHRPSHTSAQEYTPKGPSTPKNWKAELAYSAQAGTRRDAIQSLNLPLREGKGCMKLHGVAIGEDS
jgi:hypothetical protein